MNIHSAAPTAYGQRLAILGAVSAIAPATAADSHGHDAHAAVLKLNDGARWQTDAALRTGMESIRGALAQALPEVHAGRFSTAQYQALGDSVEQQVGYVVQNCKLEPGGRRGPARGHRRDRQGRRCDRRPCGRGRARARRRAPRRRARRLRQPLRPSRLEGAGEWALSGPERGKRKKRGLRKLLPTRLIGMRPSQPSTPTLTRAHD